MHSSVRMESGLRDQRSLLRLLICSAPLSDDYRVYLLSTNRERSLWILWLRGDDGENGRPQYCRIATSRPYRGYSARFAAEQLLIKSWQDERDKWGIGAPWALPMSEGLLTEEDINRIKLVVFGEL